MLHIAWASALLVQTFRAMPQPLYVGRVTGQTPTLFCILATSLLNHPDEGVAGRNPFCMEYLFSDLKNLDSNTLYIVGNGFDLFHDIRSSYQHFYYWLKCIGEDNFVSELERIYPEKMGDRPLLWSDFERALGEYNIDTIYKDSVKNLDPEDEKVITAAKEKIHPVISKIPQLMRQWAKQIDKSKVKSELPLSKKSYYLTFNYTDTLETIYGIPSENICHIHGRCSDDAKPIVVGHRKYVSESEIENKEYHYYEEQARLNIVREMNSMCKNHDENTERHKRFFDSLSIINRVVILGHSLSQIDLPYIGKIKRKVSEDAHWFISKYKPTDEQTIQERIKDLSIKEENRWIINF
ncbi:MAG: bacteriophage abortive infection AbiH family protein [Prevotella sp.]|nr:bacteriophage abortive infection AbiH family protein [Prevotella sp.]